MPDMREEFEAAYPLPEGMERNGDSYSGGEMWWLWEERWQVWQRSRAALRVELPVAFPSNPGTSEKVMWEDSVIAALQQAGIEVK